MLFMRSGFSAICFVNSSSVCKCGSMFGFVNNSISCAREFPFVSTSCLSGICLSGCNGGKSFLLILVLVVLVVFHAGLFGSIGGNVLFVCITGVR